MNELSSEKSPYLIQHKDNPVWWKPWGEKAFKKAQQEKKIIFLSIGYATCHWCHVMEKESFEDSQVAALLNKDFISIKVDREELPDVDQIYMDALHMLGQRGGWPLNIFLTPDLKPIYGGTYFPKPYFMQLLQQVQGLWSENYDKVTLQAGQLVDILKEHVRLNSLSMSSDKIQDDYRELSQLALEQFQENYDSHNGGFGEAPKFPPHSQISLLFRLYKATQDKKILNMCEQTLQHMARGGLYDHIGGGFTRYSVDERWEIPHFEKMLYVNALATVQYLEAYLVTQNSDYLEVAQDILKYVLRDMQSSASGFYSAEDADSAASSGPKEEGAFYVWSYEELETLLDKMELEFLKKNFSVTESGNFENKYNHLHLVKGDFWQLRREPLFNMIRTKLFEARDKRERPLLDDKQLTSWNALMIKALAFAYKVTGEAEYLASAQQSAQFIMKKMFDGKRLYRRYRDGQVSYTGTLEDYAYTIESLIELYQASFEEEYLLFAKYLQDIQNILFSDSQGGGFFYTSHEEKHLLVRSKEWSDGALPNPNFVSLQNLFLLSSFFEESVYEKQVNDTLRGLKNLIKKYPTAYATGLLTMDRIINNESKELVIAGDFSELLKKMRGLWQPYLLLAVSTDESEIPLSKNKNQIQGQAAYYLCHKGACNKPSVKISDVLAQI